MVVNSWLSTQYIAARDDTTSQRVHIVRFSSLEVIVQHLCSV